MSQNSFAITPDEAIRQLVINIHRLDELRSLTEKFNIFKILKADRVEIRHSNMLAWLLDPKASHGLGDRFLRCLLQKTFEMRKIEDASATFSVDENLLLTDLHRFKVDREHSFSSENNLKKRYIDLILTRDDSYQEKIAIVIENKVYSKEHSNQLQVYWKHVTTKEFPSSENPDVTHGWKHLFILLSPDGMPPSEGNEDWISLSYGKVKEALETVIKGRVLSEDVHLLMRHYIEILDEISNDQDSTLEHLCKSLYKDHRVAFNTLEKLMKKNSPTKEREKKLINEYRNEINVVLNHKIGTHDILLEYLIKNDYDLFSKESSKRYIEFYTKEMDNIFPGGKGRAYKYFFFTWEDSLGVYLELLGDGYDDYKEIMDAVIEFQMTNERKRAINDSGRPFNQYRRIFSKIEYINTDKNIEKEVTSCAESLLDFVRTKQAALIKHLQNKGLATK